MDSGSKRPKAIQCWDRDIICSPQAPSATTIPFPRGKYCVKLGQRGRIGKIRLLSTMTVEEVNFPFSFLQATGCGSRSLTVPSVSSAFQWTAQQVAKLGGSKQPIYILARDKLMETCEVRIHCIHLILAAIKYQLQDEMWAQS